MTRDDNLPTIHLDEENKDASARGRRQRLMPMVSAVLSDGALVEMVHDRHDGKTALVVWQKDRWELHDSLSIDPLHRLVPYSPHNNLLTSEVVLLPSAPEEYESEAALIGRIQAYIHRYVDVSPLYERIASYYVLFSWVYDGFNELPYLRLRGDPGSGKTRFLLTVGSLCYKPIFASGASTVSPIFRILDAFRGTLVIDEGDFRMSDERAEIVKILNNGNARGFPVLRSEVTPQKEFNPRAYTVFGPKLVATRGFFEDRALESRCLTEEMGQRRLRDDIPINLPEAQREEALHLRNQLLLFRFRNLNKRRPSESLVDRTIEPRLNQVFAPLLSIVDDENAREAIVDLARQYNSELLAERGLEVEAQVLEIIRDILASPYEAKLTVKDITSWFSNRHGEEYERKITAKWVGGIIRRRLRLKTQKSHGTYAIPPSEEPKLRLLFERYGIEPMENVEEPYG